MDHFLNVIFNKIVDDRNPLISISVTSVFTCHIFLFLFSDLHKKAGIKMSFYNK